MIHISKKKDSFEDQNTLKIINCVSKGYSEVLNQNFKQYRILLKMSIILTVNIFYRILLELKNMCGSKLVLSNSLKQSKFIKIHKNLNLQKYVKKNK